MDTKALWLTREQVDWLADVIDNTPYDEALDKDHRGVVMSTLYRFEQEWSNN